MPVYTYRERAPAYLPWDINAARRRGSGVAAPPCSASVVVPSGAVLLEQSRLARAPLPEVASPVGAISFRSILRLIVAERREILV